LNERVKAAQYKAVGELKELFELFGIVEVGFGGKYGSGGTNANLLKDVRAAVSGGWTFSQLWTLVETKAKDAADPVTEARVRYLYKGHIKFKSKN